MLWKKKPKIKAAEAAEMLFNELVKKRVVYLPSDFHVAETAISRFENKVELYQFAVVLMALLGEEQSDPKFVPVRECLEVISFPASQNERMSFLSDVKTAVMDLDDLLHPNEKEKTTDPCSWASGWFENIGVNESNPAVLAVFASSWVRHYVAVVNALRDISRQVL